MFNLKVRELSKIRAYDVIFSGISFEIGEGDLLWLKGANGSGKTSLMRILAGLSLATSGIIELHEKELHYVSHQISLNPALSVQETIEVLFPLYGIKSTESYQEFLSAADLMGTQNLSVSLLSAGQKQRLKLLMLCLEKRPLWLLDEPYSHLDQSGRDWLNRLIKQHLAADGAVIVTSHSDQLQIDPTQTLMIETDISA